MRYLQLIKLKLEHESFVSVIPNVAGLFEPVLDNITQFADQIRIRLVSQLINRIPWLLQKLLKYFNGTIIQDLMYHYHLFELLFFV